MAARAIHASLIALLLAGAYVPAASAIGCRGDIAATTRVGTGEFCVLGFCLYKAELWSARPRFSPDAPFALVLNYERSVSAEKMVATGISEIERLATQPLPSATVQAWRNDMKRAFGDVSRGDELCGVYLPGRGARFYANGVATAQVDDEAFARAFFGIWLDPRTRAPSLRERLLGGGS